MYLFLLSIVLKFVRFGLWVKQKGEKQFEKLQISPNEKQFCVKAIAKVYLKFETPTDNSLFQRNLKLNKKNFNQLLNVRLFAKIPFI